MAPAQSPRREAAHCSNLILKCQGTQHSSIRITGGARIRPLRPHTQTSWKTHDHGQFSTLLHGHNLFQEYVVDAWTMIEQDRVQWKRNNQDTLCAEEYAGLQDELITGRDLNPVGKRAILAESFTEGPRW
ncbi:unnamed protein product [Tilletia caries]|nr:unnamed protein product [Tilletia caries]